MCLFIVNWLLLICRHLVCVPHQAVSTKFTPNNGFVSECIARQHHLLIVNNEIPWDYYETETAQSKVDTEFLTTEYLRWVFQTGTLLGFFFFSQCPTASKSRNNTLWASLTSSTFLQGSIWHINYYVGIKKILLSFYWCQPNLEWETRP